MRLYSVRPRWLVAGAFLVVGLGLGPLTAHEASAHISPCRSDPVIVLTNGVTINLYEDIYDAPSDVTKITYQLHVPARVTVKSISFIGAIAAGLQSVSVTSDDSVGYYDSYTTVYTRTAGIAISAHMTANSSISANTNGSSGQNLHSRVRA